MGSPTSTCWFEGGGASMFSVPQKLISLSQEKGNGTNYETLYSTISTNRVQLLHITFDPHRGLGGPGDMDPKISIALGSSDSNLIGPICICFPHKFTRG